jgi:hypothetical protein
VDREINRKMLYEIADIIEMFPEHHDQDLWIMNDVGDASSSILWNGETISCGTAQCVAGWAVILENGGLDSITLDGFTSDEEVHFSNGNSCSRYNDEFYMENGARILGLNDSDAYNLFMTTDVVDYDDFDMPRVLREIADGESVSKALNDAWGRDDEGYY